MFCFANSTCKKISKYPNDLYGVWSCDHNTCSFKYLRINRNGTGEYGFGSHKGCNQHAAGKVRYNKTHLYIGTTKLKFSYQLKTNSTDSISLLYDHKNHNIGETLHITESKLWGGSSFTFYKIEDF